MPLPVQWFTIPAGDAGVMATLALMRQYVYLDAANPIVRELAASCVVDAGRDPGVHARALYDWIDTHTQFLPDPVHLEALARPVDLVTRIVTRGLGQVDCDDVAMLAAALGMSIGLRARFCVVSFRRQAPFAHVFTELAASTGATWMAVDPTRPWWALPTVVREAIVDV